MAGGFRATAAALAHRPFQTGNAQKYIWNLALAFDGVIEKLTQGVHGHFIEDADGSMLGAIASERLVLKGLTEPDESFRVRLQNAFADLQRAGNAWAVLSQVRGYLLNDIPAARTVSAQYSPAGVAEGATWQEYIGGEAVDVPPVYTRDSTGNWDWDSASPTLGSWGWWRWYLVLEGGGALADTDWLIGDADAPDIGDVETWCIGFGCSWKVPVSLRIIIEQWGSAWCHWVVVTFDNSLFTSTGTAGVENPDGLYGHGWKVVARHHVASRDENARYCIGDL
jgi:hypothetical protein